MDNGSLANSNKIFLSISRRSSRSVGDSSLLQYYFGFGCLKIAEVCTPLIYMDNVEGSSLEIMIRIQIEPSQGYEIFLVIINRVSFFK